MPAAATSPMVTEIECVQNSRHFRSARGCNVLPCYISELGLTFIHLVMEWNVHMHLPG